jgi:hypothetical protein
MKAGMSRDIVFAAVVSAAVVLGAAGTSRAPLVPYQFEGGTTISSSQVNDNFSALANGLPSAKWVSQSTNLVTLTTSWQNITSITVTPTADGLFFLMATANLRMQYTQGSSQNPEYAGPFVNVCLTTTSNGGYTDAVCTGVGLQVFSGQQNVAVPLFGIFTGVSQNTPVTYYLTGSLNPSSSGGTLTSTASGSIGALFLKNYLQ